MNEAGERVAGKGLAASSLSKKGGTFSACRRRDAGSLEGETATCSGGLTARLVQYSVALTTPRPTRRKASLPPRLYLAGCSQVSFGFCFGLRGIFLTAFTRARRKHPERIRDLRRSLKGHRNLSLPSCTTQTMTDSNDPDKSEPKGICLISASWYRGRTGRHRPAFTSEGFVRRGSHRY